MKRANANNCPYVAILFRDGDGTRSKEEWAQKWASIESGFMLEDFHYGVPMVPQPKSEAWLLQAHRDHAELSHTYEDITGSKTSSIDLKEKLKQLIDRHKLSREHLVELIDRGVIDPNSISAECVSFNKFKESLEFAVKCAMCDSV